MASMHDELAAAQQIQDAIVALVCEIPCPGQSGFGTTGRAAPLDYGAAFGALAGDGDARELLSHLKNERASVVRAFGVGDEDAALACAALRPHLHRLLASLKAAGPALDGCGAGVTCAWTSPLEAADKKGQYRSYEAGGGAAAFSARAREAVALDAVAVSAREAVCRERLARELATSGGGGELGPRLKKAAAVLRAAAGLWEAAAGGAVAALDALPAGCALASGDARPPEATRAVCAGEALICTASAQRMAVGSALATTGLPDSLAAKLCGGVVDKLTAARDAARDGAPAHAARADQGRANAVSADAKLFAALRAWYCARQAQTDGAYGVAVGWYDAARAALEPRVLTMSGAGSVRDTPFKTFKAAVSRALKAAQSDNNKIYYETVPAAGDLKLPPSVKTMAPEPPPPAYDAPATLKPPQLSDEALARKLQDELDEPPPPAYDAPAAPRLSDEELARKLQAELNAS